MIAISITALCVSIAAAAIALLSWLTNLEKLRLDLSARRYKVYDDLRRTARKISDIGDDASEMGDLLRDLESVRMESSFLFRRDIENEIENIVQTAGRLVTHIDQRDNQLPQIYQNEKFQLTTGIWYSTLFLSRELNEYIDFRDVASKRVTFADLIGVWVSHAKRLAARYRAFVEKASRGE